MTSYEIAANGYSWVYDFAEEISCRLDPSTDLKNGDSVTVTISYDTDMAERNNLKIGTTLSRALQ